MYPKLLVIIVAAGATALALLVNRQQRIEAAHDISVTHQRVIQHHRAIQSMRARLVERCQPNDIRDRLAELDGTWVPRPDIMELLDRRHIQLANHFSMDPADGLGDL